MTAENPVQIILSALWSAFGPVQAAHVLSRLAKLSRNPFKWHSVIQGLTHASTWPGTALAYRLLVGSVLFGESAEGTTCDSHCEFCGHHSVFQTSVKSFHTALNYPKVSHSSLPPVSFVNKFIDVIMHVLTGEASPLRIHLAEIIGKAKSESTPETCPLSLFPDLLRILDLEYREYFFSVLSLYFPPDRSLAHSPSARRTRVPSVSSFLVMLGAKGYESVTVEGGREFDSLMIEAVVDFTSSLPVEVMSVPIQHSPRPHAIASPQLLSTSLINVIKHSLVSMFLPPSEWMANFAFDNVILKDVTQLQRCRQFMEPSAVLSVIRHMLTQPGGIPDLNGSNEDKFNYHIGDIKITNFDINRSICVVKSVKTSGAPVATPSEGMPSFARQTSGASQSAQLVLTVKEVHVDVEHTWRLDWNLKRNGSYFGKNVVKVKGLSSQIVFTIYPDDRGTVVESAKISLGHVDHSCNILNSNFISELLAQAALDWFAEPLTRLLQTASQSAIEGFLKMANVTFRLQVWNGTVLKLFPPKVIGQMLQCLNDHLPKHGVPL